MTERQPKVLIVENDSEICESLEQALKSEAFDVKTASDAAEARSLMGSHKPDAVVADIWLPGASGGQLVREFKLKDPDCRIIATTRYATIERAVEAIREGAYDFLVKPIPKSVLIPSLRRALGHKMPSPPVYSKVEQPAGQVELLPGVVGSSPALREVARFIQRAAVTGLPILLFGESGTGKETLARAVHELSAHNAGPFAVVNCEAAPEDKEQLEKKIFGEGPSDGLLGEARSGLIFFDEITHAGNSVQSRLMKLLTAGSAARFVFATRVKPVDAVRRGLLRRDFYYRLSAATMEIPPLRKRVEDIPPLVNRFIDKYSAGTGKDVTGVAPGALEKLMGARWPGNVRELEHAVERAVILASSDVLHPADIPEPALYQDEGAGSIEIPLGLSLRDAEKRIIEEVLAHCGGNKREAAKLLGIGVRTVYRKIAPTRKRSVRSSRRRQSARRAAPQAGKKK